MATASTRITTSGGAGQLNFAQSNGSTLNAKMACSSDGTVVFSATSGSKVTLSGVAQPTQKNDVATKEYVDNITAGLAYKRNVDAANADGQAAAKLANFTFTSDNSGNHGTWTGPGGAEPGQLVLDGHTCADGERILIHGLGNGNSAEAEKNGIFVVSGAGGSEQTVLTRTTDFDGTPGTGELQRASVLVNKGSLNKGKRYILSTIDLSTFVLNDSTNGHLDFQVYSLASNLESNSISAAHLQNQIITGGGETGKIAPNTITDAELGAKCVTTAKIDDNAVTSGKLNANCAGDGLTQAVGGALQVNTDGTGIEISGDALQLKNDGVTAAKLNIDCAGDGLIQAGSGALQVNVDGASLEISTDALQLKADGVLPSHLHGNCAGDGLTQAGGSGALQVNVDGASLEISTDALQLKNSGVTAAKLNVDCAGDGLTQAGSGALQVNVDDASLEIATDTIQLKADGVQASHLHTNCAGDGLVPNGSTGALDVQVGGGIEIASDTVQLATGGVVAAKIGVDAVTAAKLNADCAGDGLTQAGSGALQVNTDGTGIEISGDALQLKNSGVTAAKLNVDCAGDGLTQAGSGALQVNVDDASLEIATDTIQLKADGVQASHLHTNCAGDGLVPNGSTGALDVQVDDDTLKIDTNTVKINPGGFTLSTGIITCQEFIANSDRTLKQNIEPMAPAAALEAVGKMGACSYQFKATPEDPRCGVIAQELAEVAPELVKTTSKGTLAVDYNDMSAYLIGAIQALKQKVDEQAAFIEEMKAKCPAACGEGK